MRPLEIQYGGRTPCHLPENREARHGAASPGSSRGSAWVTALMIREQHAVLGHGESGPRLGRRLAPGDNLYTNSTLALDPDTGKIKFHFQYTPHDMWITTA